MKYYASLKRLLPSIGELKFLQEIIKGGCIRIEEHLTSMGNLFNLKKINFYSCRNLKTLFDTIGNLKYLELLDLNLYKLFERLLLLIEVLESLQKIVMDECI